MDCKDEKIELIPREYTVFKMYELFLHDEISKDQFDSIKKAISKVPDVDLNEAIKFYMMCR